MAPTEAGGFASKPRPVPLLVPQSVRIRPNSEPNLRKILRAWNSPAFLRIECGIGPAPGGANMKRSFTSLNPQEALHVAIFIEERNAELYRSEEHTSEL